MLQRAVGNARALFRGELKGAESRAHDEVAEHKRQAETMVAATHQSSNSETAIQQNVVAHHSQELLRAEARMRG